MKSIIERIGTKEFVRVRIGIGRSDTEADLADHVLKPLSAGGRKEMKKFVSRAADAVLVIIEGGVEAAMNRFNA